MQISNLCLRQFWHRAMKHPISQMSGSSELWNEKTNKPSHSSPVNLLVSGQMPWCQKSFSPGSHTSRQCQKEAGDLLDTKVRRFLTPEKWCLWPRWSSWLRLWGEMCAGSSSCTSEWLLVSQIIHLICSWSEVPPDSDGLMGDSPGLCTEVSGMSQVCW